MSNHQNRGAPDYSNVSNLRNELISDALTNRNNIDDQLLTVDKQNNLTRVKLEQIANAANSSHQNQNHQLQQLQQQVKAYQNPMTNQIDLSLANMGNQHHLHHHHHQQQQQQQQQQQHQLSAAAAAAAVASQQLQLNQNYQHLAAANNVGNMMNDNTIGSDGNLVTHTPPPQEFLDRSHLNDFIQDFARKNGFGIVIAHSNKKAIYYTCELGGRYRQKKLAGDMQDDEDDINLHTKTKKLKCPFAMTANFKKSTKLWTLKTTNNHHNHAQLDPLMNHPMLRKRSDELNKTILELYKNGTKPLRIESKIKDIFPNILIKREDIYNEIRGYKRKLRKMGQNQQQHQDDLLSANSGELMLENELEELRRADIDEQLMTHHHNQQQQQMVEQYHLQQQAAQHAQAQAQAAVHHAQQMIANEDRKEITIDNIDSTLVGK